MYIYWRKKFWLNCIGYLDQRFLSSCCDGLSDSHWSSSHLGPPHSCCKTKQGGENKTVSFLPVQYLARYLKGRSTGAAEDTKWRTDRQASLKLQVLCPTKKLQRGGQGTRRSVGTWRTWHHKLSCGLEVGMTGVTWGYERNPREGRLTQGQSGTLLLTVSDRDVCYYCGGWSRESTSPFNKEKDFRANHSLIELIGMSVLVKTWQLLHYPTQSPSIWNNSFLSLYLSHAS